MPITPSNPPNYTSNPQAAIPVYLASGDISTGFIYNSYGSRSLNVSSTGNQSVLGLTYGVTLSAGARYYIECQFGILYSNAQNNMVELAGLEVQGATNPQALAMSILRYDQANPSASTSAYYFTTAIINNVTPMFTVIGNHTYVGIYTMSGFITIPASGNMQVRPVIQFNQANTAGGSASILAGAYMRATQQGTTASTTYSVGTWS